MIHYRNILRFAVATEYTPSCFEHPHERLDVAGRNETDADEIIVVAEGRVRNSTEEGRPAACKPINNGPVADDDRECFDEDSQTDVEDQP
ncbi:MAG: hypothetical protein RL077_1186 [Verrucomicrobiota bacterium]